MKHLQLVLWLIGWTVSCMAQNYQLIQPNYVNHFLADREILSIRIDAMQTVGAKTHYYNHKTMAPYSSPTSNCALIQVDSSWLGTSVEVDTNGIYTFNNHQTKALVVHSQAFLNDSWTLYNWSNGDYIEATIIAVDTMTVLGVLDTIKVLSLQARNAVAPFFHPVNNRTIRFSKNHGLIDWFAIANFPDNLEMYHLVGTTNGNLGISNLETTGIFDYEIGDEFHIIREAGTAFGPYQVEHMRHLILDKSTSNNQSTMIYTVQVCSTIYIQTDTIIMVDTLQEVVSVHSDKWSALSYELRADGQSYAVFAIDSVFGKLTKRIDMQYYQAQPNCWEPFWGISPPHNDYMEGLGGPYYNNTTLGPGAIDFRKLVYYDKNGITAGTPLVTDCSVLLPNVILNEEEEEIQIFPNPFQDKTTIAIQNFDVNDEWTLELYNSLGKQLRSLSIQDAQFDLEKAGLPAGMYICQFRNQQKKKTYTQKIIIE